MSLLSIELAERCPTPIWRRTLAALQLAELCDGLSAPMLAQMIGTERRVMTMVLCRMRRDELVVDCGHRRIGTGRSTRHAKFFQLSRRGWQHI